MSYIHELDDDKESATERIGETLKEARDADTIDKKIASLSTAMHLLIGPNISNNTLDNFLTEMLEFAELNDHRVLCLIIDFLLKASAKDFTICNKTVERYSFYLTPNNSISRYESVIKRVIVASTSLYPIILEFAIMDKNDRAESCWEAFNELKARIITLVDDVHEGVRTVTVKFLEALILCQSPKPKELTADPKSTWAIEANTRFHKISLTDVPRSHRFLSYHKAQLEAEQNFSSLIKQTSVAGITSQNLIAVIESLCMITRCRPQWENALPRVFDVIKTLHSNVPPMLSTGQVKFLRKSFKYNLLRFLKLPASVPLQQKITTMLTNYLGASPREVNQSIPQELIQRAAPPREPATEPAAKRAKLQNPIYEDDDDDDEAEASTSTGAKDARTQAVDITSKYILERLNHETVLNLVKISLYTLPTEMPPAFASSYTPIANAGSESNRQEIAELMAAQMVHKEVGPGFEWLQQKKKKEYEERIKARNEGIVIAQTPLHEPIRAPVPVVKQPVPETAKAPVIQKAKKAFNLVEETEKIDAMEAMEMFEMAFESVLQAERRAVAGGAKTIYQKLVVRLATRFWEDCAPYENKLVEFILSDHKKRSDLALLWLCELYAQYQGYSNCALRIKDLIAEQDGMTQPQRLERYDFSICKILDAMLSRNMHKETLFYKVLLETPLLTPNAIERLKKVCLEKENEHGMFMLRESIMVRNRQRPQLLQFLFGLCFLDRPELRSSCLEVVKELSHLPFIRSSLCDQARMQINDCLEDKPPMYMRKPDGATEWTNEMYRNALAVYTTLMPADPMLLLPLAAVYAQATNLYKRAVLGTLEPVFRQLSQENVIALIQDCPHGAETLVARLVVLLTERITPSSELIQKLKILHDERKMDIRALLPIIGGLEKEEVIALIPTFIFRPEYQKSVTTLFRKLYTVRDHQTGELVFDPIEIIKEYHKIEPKDDNEAELLVNNLEFLFDPALLKPDIASGGIEAVFKWEKVPFLFLHSLYTLYHKFKTFESFVANLFFKVTEKKMYQQSIRWKQAFFKCVRELKSKAYPAVLTLISFEEYEELKEELGAEVVVDFKAIYSTLSTLQQKNMDEKIKEELYDKERENRERDRRLRREERKEKEKERSSRR
ncbi:CRE-SYMK-1 protein [Caenorhabditis remanei]|uniref:CRE-SYMK-1 protein n=1 Tax=Caenorhabditis remanei TaxID=31234 RepID=E3LZX0_CAERE|nr:CRE-SYMK-1 protein [Caenorhabditis remanei]